MRMLLTLFVLFVTTQAFAWEVDSTKALSDLLYIPAQGSFYGQTSLDAVYLEGTIRPASGGKVDFESRSNSLKQVLGYGITERWQVGFQYQNQFYDRTQIDNNGSNRSTGGANPQITTLYRLLKQEDDSINLDLRAGLEPDLIDSETNSDTDTSNYASGGSNILIGGRAGKKWINVDMKAELDIAINGKTETKDSATGKGKIKTDGYGAYRIAYFAQLPLEQGFFVRGKLESIRSGELTRKQDGQKSKLDSTSSSELAGSIVYNAVQNPLVVEAGLGLLGVADYKLKTSAGKQKYEDVSGTRVFLNALYQF